MKAIQSLTIASTVRLSSRISRFDVANREWRRLHAVAAAEDATPEDMARLNRATTRVDRADKALLKALAML